MKTNFQKAMDFFWENRERYRKEIGEGEKPNFFSPKYANLPEKILRKLTSEEIDIIQNLWSQLLGWDTFDACVVAEFETKEAYCSAMKKRIKEELEKEKNRTEEVILGDFLAWAIKNKWWIRGFESIIKTKNGAGQDGYSFQWATQCGFVTDEDIRKVVPKKTASQWDCWGR